MSRCLYHSSFEDYLKANDNAIFGELCDNYHGDALTTTRESWKAEIAIMRDVLSSFDDKSDADNLTTDCSKTPATVSFV